MNLEGKILKNNGELEKFSGPGTIKVIEKKMKKVKANKKKMKKVKYAKKSKRK